MTKLYGPFALVVAILVMGVSIYAVPFPGNLLLVGAAVLGLITALLRLRQGDRRAD